MRIAVAGSVLLCCLAAGLPAARAEGVSPFGWLCCCRDKSHAVRTTNVSNTSKTPQVFAKMKGGTRRLVSGTKNLFVTAKPAKTRGVTATYPAARPPRPKQSFFKRFFNREPPPAPKTIDEWMSLEQIHP